jgi:predicted nuclease of restriction endonuclease-like (RecB) superfamily
MLLNNKEYLSIVDSIKSQIKTAQYKAVMSVNSELLLLYWNVGSTINAHSEWGNKFIENLARDIKLEFPQSTGFSVRNLKYMAKFAKTWSNVKFVQRYVAQIPWRHNIAIMDKVKDEKQREWYVRKSI